MPTQRNRVYYCDDQQEFIDSFVKAHATEFDIHTNLDISRVKADVQDLIANDKCPDIILLDRFHPKTGPDFEERKRLAKAKLVELTQKIAEIRPCIEAAWKPEGIEALKELRTIDKLRHVPILFYTQRGLVFLGDKELIEIYKYDSDWMLKDSDSNSPISERARINQMVRRYQVSNQRTLPVMKAIGISLASIIATAIASTFLQGPISQFHGWAMGLFG